MARHYYGHRRMSRHMKDFLQNMLEDWAGNGVMVGLFCAGSWIYSLL